MLIKIIKSKIRYISVQEWIAGKHSCFRAADAEINVSLTLLSHLVRYILPDCLLFGFAVADGFAAGVGAVSVAEAVADSAAAHVVEPPGLDDQY
jgi:hypothetical protein